MIRNLLYFLLIYLVFSFETSNAQNTKTVNILRPSNKVSSEKQQLIYEKVNLLPNNSELAFALIEGGKTEFYGVKRQSDTIKYIENYKSLFEIASITKVFTATLLADFVLKGKFKLTDTVNNFIDLKFNNNAKKYRLTTYTIFIRQSSILQF